MRLTKKLADMIDGFCKECAGAATGACGWDTCPVYQACERCREYRRAGVSDEDDWEAANEEVCNNFDCASAQSHGRGHGASDAQGDACSSCPLRRLDGKVRESTRSAEASGKARLRIIDNLVEDETVLAVGPAAQGVLQAEGVADLEIFYAENTLGTDYGAGIELEGCERLGNGNVMATIRCEAYVPWESRESFYEFRVELYPRYIGR